jgi:hypothetical protein
MARATTSAPGMPKAKTILAEKVFTPPRAITSAKAAVEAPKYRIIITNQVDAYDAPLAADEISTFGMKRLPPGDNFAGTSRKAAKLSIAEATTEVFKDIKDLIKSLVPDKTMAKRKPPIATTAGSNRVAEEKRNARVRAFLYAASREDDNDFHLIIGRAPRSSPMYMTMELSGLPPKRAKSFATLKKARDAYKDFFGDDLPGPSYHFYRPPIPIEVEGSLFFDMSHATGGKPGPQDLRKDIPTIWEVHPITRIVFEP